MGMTIDNARSAIEMLQTQLEITNQPRSLAFDTAIDTMRKYQKIEQIIKDHDADRIPEDYWYIDKIREVLEDGKS